MMAHDQACGCDFCRHVRQNALPITQSDRDALADAWAEWRYAEAGEVLGLRQGADGNPGSTRWVALQAIAATRSRLAPAPAPVGERA